MQSWLLGSLKVFKGPLKIFKSLAFFLGKNNRKKAFFSQIYKIRYQNVRKFINFNLKKIQKFGTKKIGVKMTNSKKLGEQFFKKF